MIKVDSAQFEMLAEPPIPGWVMRVSVKGSGFVHRAIPLGAQVGDVTVEGIQIDLDGAGFTGYLSREPANGAQLLVGYLEGDLIDSGMTYDAPVA